MKNIFLCNFDKNSIASILIALENNINIDDILYVEPLFGQEVNTEFPEHNEFIKKIITKFKKQKLPIHVLKSEKTYLNFFLKKYDKGNIKGLMKGFHNSGKCTIKYELKENTIKLYLNQNYQNYTDIVGFAYNEKEKLNKLKYYKNSSSLLEKYKLNDNDTFKLCYDYDLLSPTYEYTNVIKCWCCPYNSLYTMSVFREKHPDLWTQLQYLATIRNLRSYKFKNSMTIKELNNYLDIEDYKRKNSIFENL